MLGIIIIPRHAIEIQKGKQFVLIFEKSLRNLSASSDL